MPSADHPTTRRDFLKATAAGAAGLPIMGQVSGSTNPMLPGPTGQAKACISINLVGGPSHIDTFDPKPDAPAEVRGPFRPIPTRVPGVYLSELFPKMAAVADKFALVRSMHHDAPPIHEAGFQLLNTGRLFRDGPEWPSVGAVVSYLRGVAGGRAGYCVIPTLDINTGVSISHGQGNAHLGREPGVWHGGGPDGSPGSPCSRLGASEFGKNCAWAAMTSRLGMPFVTINMYSTVFDAVSWDCHADRGSLATSLDDYRTTVAPAFDTAFAHLITDLEDRGLLDSTLVVATGEFGRTPHLNANGGRDHWAGCWTAIVAGGGVKGGRVIGGSDGIGAEPTDRPVTPQELVATIFHALGISPSATIPSPTGEPVAVYPAKPVLELF
ncbi:MAG: hypothetical protein JWO38_5588 [Gemmataceae bacterium]|nr:hypothetical protein [Gemmataceae bacterium]